LLVLGENEAAAQAISLSISLKGPSAVCPLDKGRRSSSPSLIFLVLFSATLVAIVAGCRGFVGTVPTSVAGGANTNVPQRFGLHIHDAIHHWPSVTFGYWRVWDAGVTWPQVETSRGVYDFSLFDQYVALAEQHNLKIIYTIGNTPQWTSTDPNRVGYQGLPGATAPPQNMQDWQDYVRTIASRYKGKIYAYEIWNEVNLDGYWTGSVAQMVQIAQVAYQTIKQVDPAAVVLAPSVVQEKGKDYMRNFFNAGGDKYSDGVAYHLYDTNPTPELIVDRVYNDTSAIAKQWGKQIWDTEVGWGPWGTPSSNLEAASFTARTMILQAAAGINVVVWFAWDDRDWDHIPFVGPDFQTPTAAAGAFNQVQAWLLNSTITCTSTPDGTFQCPVTQADGKQKYIVWNMQTNTTFAVPSSWQVKTVTDLAGSTQAIPGSSISIGIEPVLVSP
jgi:hypothetical protein